MTASTQNQPLQAILFLYREILEQELDWMTDVVRAKTPERLPVVLSVDETTRLLKQLTGHQLLMVQLLYGAGLRLMECVRLRVKDIDFDYMQIVVRSGKGDKDRVTLLPDSLADDLKLQLERVRNLHAEDLEQGFGEVWLPECTGKTISISWKGVGLAVCISSNEALNRPAIR